MSYIVVTENDNLRFNKKSDLLEFLKEKFKNDLINVYNQFFTNNNIIIVKTNINNAIYIGIPIKETNGNQFKKTYDLYKDIGKYLGCFSEIF